MPVDVRFGSKADIVRGLCDVRFTPKSGHWNSVVEGDKTLRKADHQAFLREFLYIVEGVSA